MSESSVKVRRFEPGASATGLDGFLNRLGYTIKSNGSHYFIRKPGQKGKAKGYSQKQLVALLDSERVKRGLQPVVKVMEKSKR